MRRPRLLALLGAAGLVAAGAAALVVGVAEPVAAGSGFASLSGQPVSATVESAKSTMVTILIFERPPSDVSPQNVPAIGRKNQSLAPSRRSG